MNIDYSNQFSRNWLFISDELQEKLKKCKILCCGTGLGSFIAELLVRTGFTNITIADGDSVSLSNLNRQSFLFSDLDNNKAHSLNQKLLQINPQANITVVQKFLLENDLMELISSSDYVVNTIDFDHNSFKICSDLCREYGKIELFPTNVGFGGSVIVFNKDSPEFGDYFQSEDHKELKFKIFNHLASKFSLDMKADLEEYLIKRSKVGYDPQLGISSFITSALLVTTILRILDGKEVKIFPDFIYSDLRDLCQK